MARGKHAAKAESRDRARAVAKVAEELALLRAEQARYDELAAASIDVTRKQATLQRVEHARRNATRTEEERLQAELDRLDSIVEPLEATARELRTRMERHLERVVATLAPPGDQSHIDLFLALLGLEGDVVITAGDHQKKIDPDDIRTIRQAKRQNTDRFNEAVEQVRELGNHPTNKTPPRTSNPIYAGHPFLTGLAEYGRHLGTGVPDTLNRQAAQTLVSNAMRMRPCSANTATATAWGQISWLSNEPANTAAGEQLHAAFGPATGSDWHQHQQAPWPAGVPSGPDCWERDGHIAVHADRLNHPHSPGTRWPRPGDATLIRHLYTQNSVWRATIAAEEPVPRTATLDDPATWRNPPTDTSRMWDDIVTVLQQAVPFWLPPGEAAAFANSEPLTPDDINEIELPYPAIVIVPSEPLVIPADVTVGDIEHLEYLELHALERFRSDTAEGRFVHYAEPAQGGWTVPFADALAARGGLIEAIVVRARRGGGLDDRVVWCVAVPHADPDAGMLARAVIPAFRSGSRYADTVAQFAAAAAWAGWHQPDGTEPLTGDRNEFDKATSASGYNDRERSGGAGGVHVLNLSSTYEQASSHSNDNIDRRTVATHLRRGHWKRVRIGSRSDWDEHRSYRRVRIPMTVVNAGKGTPAPQVYRMPSGDRPSAGP